MTRIPKTRANAPRIISFEKDYPEGAAADAVATGTAGAGGV